MLKLRRGTVVGTDPLAVEIAGDVRRAWADELMVGAVELGDELILNTAALDLSLGSGGFDVVHANLTRGLRGGDAEPGAHVMKLNYTSLQHAVEPLEEPADAPARPRRRIPVLVLPLHGHLAPAAWAASAAAGGAPAKIGFLQAAGGALPGTLSRDVRDLRERGLLHAHVTASPSYGGELEAISAAGALHAAAEGLGWDAAIVGPGPGIIGSETRYGHGGMAALDAAHASLALGLPTLLSPRLSAGDARPRHLGLSHHTRSVLALLLAGVAVPVPSELEELWPAGDQGGAEALRAACGELHALRAEVADLEGYATSGLPTCTMGRDLAEDRLFFAAPLAAGAALAAAIAPG